MVKFVSLWKTDIADETRDVPCITVLIENSKSAPPCFDPGNTCRTIHFERMGQSSVGMKGQLSLPFSSPKNLMLILRRMLIHLVFTFRTWLTEILQSDWLVTIKLITIYLHSECIHRLLRALILRALFSRPNN